MQKSSSHISHRSYLSVLRNKAFGLVAVMVGTMAWAGIPQPDAALYGRVTINGMPVDSSSDITIVARVDGVPKPVGAYKMGASTFAGEGYLLKLRLEVPAPGSPVRDDAARVTQVVRLNIKRGSDAEELAMNYTINAIGTLENRDLDVVLGEPVNCVPGGGTNNADFQAFLPCMGGPSVDTTPECECADVDRNNAVDLRDWAWLQASYSAK